MSGIYIHIPFCKQKCHYCSFYFSTNFNKYRSDLINSLVKELITRAPESEDHITSIYFGGGTPSILNKEELRMIMNSIYNHYKINENVEITIEANPDDVNEGIIKVWQDCKINRVSLGVQSFFDDELKTMNRGHNSEQAHEAIKLISKANFKSYSIDLIFGLPLQTKDKWLENLNWVKKYNIPHVSCYNLTVEEKTALKHLIKEDKISIVSEEDSITLFQITHSFLQENGYDHYEISNYSLKGNHSSHNTSYWEQKKYIGIGPSAHSYNGSLRRWNVSNNQQYINKLKSNEKYFSTEELTQAELYNEYLLTRLRVSEGINLTHLSNLFPKEFADFKSQYPTIISRGLMVNEGNNIKLTLEGMLISDEIISDLFIVD